MTFIRRKALETASWVVWLASPARREWAEGLEREVAVIESDWGALWWAIGSARILLEPREAPLGSLNEVPKAAQKLVVETRKGLMALLPVSQGIAYLDKLLYHSNNWSQRTGCAIALSGAVLAGTVWLIDFFRLKAPAKDDIYVDRIRCARFYRAELKHSLSRQWIYLLATNCLFAGSYVTWFSTYGKGPFQLAVAGLVNMILLPTILLRQRSALRKTEQLDVLLTGQDSAG